MLEVDTTHYIDCCPSTNGHPQNTDTPSQTQAPPPTLALLQETESIAPALEMPLTLALCESLYHLPVLQAADSLGVSPTTLGKFMRRNGVKRWPYRAIHAQSACQHSGSSSNAGTNSTFLHPHNLTSNGPQADESIVSALYKWISEDKCILRNRSRLERVPPCRKHMYRGRTCKRRPNESMEMYCFRTAVARFNDNIRRDLYKPIPPTMTFEDIVNARKRYIHLLTCIRGKQRNMRKQVKYVLEMLQTTSDDVRSRLQEITGMALGRFSRNKTLKYISVKIRDLQPEESWFQWRSLPYRRECESTEHYGFRLAYHEYEQLLFESIFDPPSLGDDECLTAYHARLNSGYKYRHRGELGANRNADRDMWRTLRMKMRLEMLRVRRHLLTSLRSDITRRETHAARRRPSRLISRRRRRRTRTHTIRPAVRPPRENILSAWPHLCEIFTRIFRPAVDLELASDRQNTVTYYRFPVTAGMLALHRFFALRLTTVLRMSLLEYTTGRRTSNSKAQDNTEMYTANTAMVQTRVNCEPIVSFLNDYLAFAHRASKYFNAKLTARNLYKTFSHIKQGPRANGADFTTAFSSIEDLGNSIGLDSREKLLLLVQKTCRSRPNLIAFVPLMRGRTLRVGAEQRCLLLNNIAPFTGYNRKTCCIHLPVSTWDEGNWIEDFELIPSNCTTVCEHWAHSPDHVEDVKYAYRVEWFKTYATPGERTKEQMGFIRISLPRTTLKGPNMADTFADIVHHFKDNCTAGVE